MYLHL